MRRTLSKLPTAKMGNFGWKEILWMTESIYFFMIPACSTFILFGSSKVGL